MAIPQNLNPDDPSFDEKIDALADKKRRLSVADIHSLPAHGPERYLAKWSENVHRDTAEFAPAFITPGFVLARENAKVGLNPDKLHDHLRYRYEGDDGDFDPEKMIEDYNDTEQEQIDY